MIQVIENESIEKIQSVDLIIEHCTKLTTAQLSFTTAKVSSNPNEIGSLRSANCVGYAAMFSSIANYIIQKNELQDEIEVRHKIGKLYLLGFDLHQWSDSPFFKDHDYNLVIDIRTRNQVAVDASLSDYFWVNRVSMTSQQNISSTEVKNETDQLEVIE